MKICDRCFRTDGSVSAAVEQITFGVSHEVLDVCLSCSEEIKILATKKDRNGAKRVGRPVGKTKNKSA